MNPIDFDMTVQMDNDRLTFHYQSIQNSNASAEIQDIFTKIQNDADELGESVSESQVEIAVDTNDIYETNATVDGVKSMLSKSYSLILPNRNSLTNNTQGVLVFRNDETYVSKKQQLDSSDGFNQQQIRTSGYPADSLVGSFVPVNDLVGGNVEDLENRVDQLEQNTVNGGGGGIVKAPNDANASVLITSITNASTPTNGDLYYNTNNKLFNSYFGDITNTDKWFPVAMTYVAGQPPPLTNLTLTNTTAYMDITWDKPYQVASPVTSSISYTNKNSPASSDMFGTNVIHFPVVNRFVMKLTKVNTTTNVEEGVQAFPLYRYNNQPLRSTFDTDGYVIYEKGNEISSQDANESTHTTYSGVNGNNVLSAMPTGIRLYKKSPTQAQRNSILSQVPNTFIIPFSSDTTGTDLNLDGNRYKIELWLENNSDDVVVKRNEIYGSFKITDPPSAPNVTTLSLSNQSTNSVTTALTQLAFMVQDPDYTAGTNTDENQILSFEEIKFEWSDDNFVSNVYEFEKIRVDGTSVTHAGTVETLTGGIYGINRFQDTVQRQYTFDLDSNYLGSSFNSSQITSAYGLSVRASYRNTSNVLFGSPSSLQTVTIDVPQTPVITDVQLVADSSSNNALRVTLQGVSDADTIISSNSTVNHNYAVFIKEIDMMVEYQQENGNVTLLENTGDVDYTYSGNANSNGQQASTTYTFDLPPGENDINGVFADSSLKWRVKVRVRNNIVNNWSNLSIISGGSGVDNETQIDGTATQNLEIGPVQGTNAISSANYDSQNHSLALSWSHPSDGERGVDASKSATSYPKVYQYGISTSVENATSSIPTVSTNQSVNYNSDASSSKSVSILTSIDSFGQTYVNASDDSSIEANGAYNTVNTTVTQRNVYIGDLVQNLTVSRYYSLRPPDSPPSSTLLSTIRSGSGYNTGQIDWSKPAFQGFRFGSIKNLSSSHNTELQIDRYEVTVEANATQTSAPYFYHSILNGSTVNPSFTTNITSGNPSVDAATITPSYSQTDVFTHPDTEYVIQIRSRNTYGLTSTNPLITYTGRTGIPGQVVSPLTSLSAFNMNKNMNNVGNYVNKGFILDTGNYNSQSAHDSTLLSRGTGQQITRQTSIDFTSDLVSHGINKDYIPKYTSDYIQNSELQKFRQFIVYDNTTAIFNSFSDRKVLMYGRYSGFTWYGENIWEGPNGVETLDTWRNRLSISSDSRDQYIASGFDIRNSGYWFQEDNVTLAMDVSGGFARLAAYSEPHKLELQLRYNKQENFANSTAYSSSNMNTDSDLDIIHEKILYNTANTNDYVYIDSLNIAPTITPRNSLDYLSHVSFTNYIQGIPNLYQINQNTGYEFSVNAILTGYSQYFGLTTEKNVFEGSFKETTNKITDNMSVINWTNKPSGATRNSDNWTLANITFDQDDFMQSRDTNYVNNNIEFRDQIFFTLDATSTNGDASSGVAVKTDSSNNTRTSYYSYDKPSVDLLSDTGFLTVDVDFDPTNSTTYMNTVVNSTQFNFYGVHSNNTPITSEDSLFLFNGKHMTIHTQEDGFANRFSSENDNYQYNIPYSITWDYTSTRRRWAIFQYTTTNTTRATTDYQQFYFYFGDDTNMTLESIMPNDGPLTYAMVSDITEDTQNESVAIYVQIEVYDGSSWNPIQYTPNVENPRKWIRYSGPKYAAMNNGNVNNLDAQYDTENYEYASQQYGNPTTNTDWVSTSYNPGNSVGTSIMNVTSGEKRTVWGIFKRQSIDMSAGEKIRFNIAIGVKEPDNIYFKKPEKVVLFAGTPQITSTTPTIDAT